MKKQRRTPGSVVKIELRDGTFSYAQILDKQLVFFDIKTRKDIELEKLADTNELFFCLFISS